MSIPQISIIVARTPGGVIGSNNSLLWSLPYDLKMFKGLTTGKPIIMGRKTYESIGRILPNRKNIIVTRSELNIEGAFCCKSLEFAIEEASSDYDGEIMIIGGSQIYAEAIEKGLIGRIYETVVHANLSGDSYFNFEQRLFNLINQNKKNMDDKNQYDMTFNLWEKIQSKNQKSYIMS